MLTWLLTYSIISVILLKDLTSTSEALSLVSCSASFWTPLFLTLELIVTDVMWVKWEKYKSEYGTFERKSICCCVWLLWLSFLFQVALRKTQHHCQPQIWVWPDINCLETISNTSLNLPPQNVFSVYGQFFFNLGNKRLTVRIHSLDTVTGNKYKHTQQVGKEGWHWHHLSLSKVQPELRMWIMSLSNSSLKRHFFVDLFDGCHS